MKFMNIVLLAFCLFPSIAASQNSDVEGLLSAIDRMCAQEVSDRDTGHSIEIDGTAGAGGVVRMFGFEAEGKISVEQYDQLNSQLKGIRRHTDDCKFEAFRLLKPVFIDQISSSEFDAVADRCQTSGNLKVCVKTLDLKRMGPQLRIPVVLSAVDGGKVLYIYDEGSSILTDTGEQHIQQLGELQVSVKEGEVFRDLFSATLEKPEDVSEIALEIKMKQPANTTMFFDGIYLD